MDGATSPDDRDSLEPVAANPTGTYAGAGSYFWFVRPKPVFVLLLMIYSLLDSVQIMYLFWNKNNCLKFNVLAHEEDGIWGTAATNIPTKTKTETTEERVGIYGNQWNERAINCRDDQDFWRSS